MEDAYTPRATGINEEQTRDLLGEPKRVESTPGGMGGLTATCLFYDVVRGEGLREVQWCFAEPE